MQDTHCLAVCRFMPCKNSIIRMYEFEIMLHKQVYVSAYIMVIALCNGQVCVWGGGGGGGRGRSLRGLNPTLSTSPTIHGLRNWIYYAYKVFLGIGTSVNGYDKWEEIAANRRFALFGSWRHHANNINADRMRDSIGELCSAIAWTGHERGRDPCPSR